MSKKKKIVFVSLALIAVLIYLVMTRKKNNQMNNDALNAQDSYYATYNQPPLVGVGSQASDPASYIFGGNSINSTTNYGVTDLDALANKLCGCMTCGNGNNSGNSVWPFDGSVYIPPLPQLSNSYVAPKIRPLELWELKNIYGSDYGGGDVPVFTYSPDMIH